MAGTPVKALIIDPDTGYHRVVETGEVPVNADGVAVGADIGVVLGIGNDADAQQIKNLADPTADQDAATKLYVDQQIGANNDLAEILANGNDAACQDIVNIDTIYFCVEGSSSASFGDPSDIWIGPDRTGGSRLIYRAEDGHEFKDDIIIGSMTLTTGGQIRSMTDPTLAQDAATKAYVDAQIVANNDLAEILFNGNDAMGQAIYGLCGIYFDTGCEGGSSDSSSTGELASWIAPDNDRLFYHADGAHEFEGVVIFTDTIVSRREADGRTATFFWDGADYRLVLSQTGADLELEIGGELTYVFDSTQFVIEKSDTGGSMDLEVTSWASSTRSRVRVSGIGSETIDASVVEFNSSGVDWRIANRGVNFTDEASDLIIMEGYSGTIWLRFDTSDALIEFGNDVEMAGKDLLNVGRIDFIWGEGPYSSSSSPGGNDGEAYIEAQGDIIVYYADGGHKFESPAWFTGPVYLDANLVVTENINLLSGAVITIDSTQVVGARVIDARADDTPNSGDSTTDGLIDALRDAMITHGLIAAA